MTKDNLRLELTGDGSVTFFSSEFGETFHSHHGARQEAELKFVEPTQLRATAHKPVVRLLDVCYGLGYNTAAAIAAIWEVNPECKVEWVGLELDIGVAKQAIAHDLLGQWPPPVPELLGELVENQVLQSKNITARLWVGDARQTIKRVVALALASGFKADAIFLDPFSPPKCPQLWTVEFLGLVAQCLSPNGRLATYSCSAAVRVALMAAGLRVGSTPPVGRRSPGTVASFTENGLPPLSQQELEHLQTRAAIPYRDPNLCDEAAAIVHRRQIEQQASDLEPTGRWKKRYQFSLQTW